MQFKLYKLRAYNLMVNQGVYVGALYLRRACAGRLLTMERNHIKQFAGESEIPVCELNAGNDVRQFYVQRRVHG